MICYGSLMAAVTFFIGHIKKALRFTTKVP